MNRQALESEERKNLAKLDFGCFMSQYSAILFSWRAETALVLQSRAALSFWIWTLSLHDTESRS